MFSFWKAFFGKCFFNGKSVVESLSCAPRLASSGALCIGNCHLLTVELYKSTEAPICPLLLNRRPPAIFRAIIAVVVDSIYRMLAAWSWPHVGVEVLKFIPSFANLYSAPTVIMKRSVGRIVAATAQFYPNVIFRRFRQSVCFVVFGANTPRNFFLLAAATRKTIFTSKHAVQSALNRVSAFALTQKMPRSILVDMQNFNNGKCAKLRANPYICSSRFRHILFWTNGYALSS